MNLLKRLAELSAGVAPTIQPRLPVRFETPLRSTEAPRPSEPMKSSEHVEMSEERVRIPGASLCRRARLSLSERHKRIAIGGTDSAIAGDGDTAASPGVPPFAFEAPRETLPFETTASSELLPRAIARRSALKQTSEADSRRGRPNGNGWNGLALSA